MHSGSVDNGRSNWGKGKSQKWTQLGLTFWDIQEPWGRFHSYSNFPYRYVWNLFTNVYNFIVAFCIFRQQDFIFLKCTVMQSSIMIWQMVSKVSSIWFLTLIFYIQNHVILDHAIIVLHIIVQDMTGITTCLKISWRAFWFGRNNFGLICVKRHLQVATVLYPMNLTQWTQWTSE